MEYLQNSRNQILGLLSVMFDGVHPEHTSIYYNRMQTIALVNFPSKKERRLLSHRVWHIFVLAQIDFAFIVMLCGLPESTGDIVAFGQDVLWLIGVEYSHLAHILCGPILNVHLLQSFYFVFKWHYFYNWTDRADDLISEIDECHRLARFGPAEPEIRSEQRTFFVVESLMGLFWHIGMFTFCGLAVLQPVWSDQKLPFHTVFPFGWHDPSRHPVAYAIIYAWQLFVLFYNMVCILNTDLFSAHLFSQLAVNLKILSIELRAFARHYHDDELQFRAEFGRLVSFHQRIINNVARTNVVFYSPLIMQIISQFLMISLSAFEALVARHDITVATRFIVFMLLCFGNHAYYCLWGDLVTYHSEQVALAAYDVYEWSPNSRTLRRDILFMIQRAQKPLYIEPSPFPPYTWISYMSIVKQCYSILTLLLEYLD